MVIQVMKTIPKALKTRIMVRTIMALLRLSIVGNWYDVLFSASTLGASISANIAGPAIPSLPRTIRISCPLTIEVSTHECLLHGTSMRTHPLNRISL